MHCVYGCEKENKGGKGMGKAREGNIVIAK